MSIADNIRIYRKKYRLSQSQLAEKLDLTRQQIANYEAGNGTVPLASVIAMSDIFNISIDELVKGDASGYQVEENTGYQVKEEEWEKKKNGDDFLPDPIKYYAHSTKEMEAVKAELQRMKYRVEDYERVFRLLGLSRENVS
jgi:transcriptional regulator with XRE-family HTH domain